MDARVLERGRQMENRRGQSATLAAAECCERMERKRSLLFALPLSFTLYRLSPTDLCIRKGLLNPAEDILPLDKAAGVALHRSPLERLFQLGSLYIATTDPAHPELRVRHIRHADAFESDFKTYMEAVSGRSDAERAVRNADP